MKRRSFYCVIFLLIAIACADKKEKNNSEIKYFQTIEFASLDSLLVTGNLYQIDKKSPFILLCHQAKFNKFEYAGIAERLNQMGYNCLAIDQRSGGPIGDKQNDTYLRAKNQNKPTNYLDAEQDIRAAIDYISNNYSKEIILWGSSYSSTLALYLATEMEDVNAVIAFSPGNYLSQEKGNLSEKLKHFTKPMFITSSKREADYLKRDLGDFQFVKNQVQFIPKGGGYHGSRALWKNQEGGDEYWKAVERFLNSYRK